MRNYYRILQVDLEAEPEVIEAAYKRLMKKYHPDVLTSEQKKDKSFLEKVQEINEAYDVLSDEKKRREYDKVSKPIDEPALPGNGQVRFSSTIIEKRIYMVRCAASKNTYRMMLARKKGTQTKFKITGFELAETFTQSQPQNGNWLANVSKTFIKRTKKNIGTPKTKTLISDDELEWLFSDENTVSLADIDWTGKNNCPDCGSEIVTPAGVINHWFRCGSCSHLYCVGNARVGKFDAITKCPWCNKTNIIQWSASKDRKQLIIGGREYEKSESDKQKLLSGKDSKSA